MNFRKSFAGWSFWDWIQRIISNDPAVNNNCRFRLKLSLFIGSRDIHPE